MPWGIYLSPSEREALKKHKGRVKMMKPHEERVVTEKRELDEKVAKLKAFCFDPGSPVFKGLSPEDRNLLEEQYDAMKHYSKILGQRIARFEK